MKCSRCVTTVSETKLSKKTDYQKKRKKIALNGTKKCKKTLKQTIKLCSNKMTFNAKIITELTMNA